MSVYKSELKLAMQRVKQIHFVGVGGVGMSGIAELFANLGFSVTGSDQKESLVTNRLVESGIKVFIGHFADNVNGADVVVTSTAIEDSNPEKIAALKQGITIIRRAEMLAELMRFKFGIAVAGTHGKTTTTSLVASILTEGGFDPTYVIGGKLISSAVNAKLGSGRYLVAEADESDASFVHLSPMMSIITNVDEDHMETYNGSVDKLHQTFIEFVHNLPFYGQVIVCIDDTGVQNILPKLSRHIISYGFSKDADIRAHSLSYSGGITNFKVDRVGHTSLNLSLNMPGEHNVLNSLAAIAVATDLGVDDESISGALKIFKGVGRRFQQYGDFMINNKTVKVIDDYGHHPSEIFATIKAARGCCDKQRLVFVFQPHRYSRTLDLFDDFVQALNTVDILILLEVYPAGEEKIDGSDSRSLAKAIRVRGVVEPIVIDSPNEVIELLESIVKDNDLVLLSGAGDIGSVAPKIESMWEAI